MTHELVSHQVDLLNTKGNPFPIEQALKAVGVINFRDRVVDCRKIFDSGRSGESWVYGFLIRLANNKKFHIKEKNFISIGGNLEVQAQTHFERFQRLQGYGIKIPKTYGAFGASLYQDFIVNDKTVEIYRKFKKEEQLGHHEAHALDDLIGIGAKLDSLGYCPLNIVKDVIFDGDQKAFFLIDVGYDLGVPQGRPGNLALNTLLQNFPKHEERIRKAYGIKKPLLETSLAR